MKKPFVPLLTAIWVSILPLISHAQIDEAAKAVIDSYIEATGGREVKESIETVIQTGTWELQTKFNVAESAGAEKGSMTVYYQLPCDYVSIMEYPGIDTVRTCFIDGKAWVESTVKGVIPLEGTELYQASKNAAIFPELEIEKLYKTIQLQEPTAEGLIQLHLVDNDGFEETWIFDPFTHLLVGMRRVLDAGARGSYSIVVSMGNYTEAESGDFKGLRTPTDVEYSTPAFKVKTTVEKTEINTGIPDYIFKKGALQK